MAMLSVNNTLPNAIHYSPADTSATQSAPIAETHAGSSSELNIKLLKELIAQMEAPNRADKLDGIRATLNQYGLDTSAEDFNNSKLRTALEHLKTTNDRAQPSDDVAEMLANQKQQVKNTALALADIQREVATNRTKANYSVSQFMADKEKAVQDADPEDSNKRDEISIHTSYAELWAKMALAIKNIKGDYVDFYADLMQKYTEMYKAYNTHVQGAAAKAVSAGDDGNNVKFDTTKMDGGYTDFKTEVDNIALSLGSVKNWDQMTPEQRKSMVTTLEPAFKVDGSGKIGFNLDQYNAAPKHPSGMDGNKVSTASYQAWLASFNGGGSALQGNMQSFAQRYTQANSTFDNLNKVLSGAIASLAESAKDVIKAFG
ncbi:IpaD/SipD/SspD family type III secretion system needle tip protein [Yersinia hibernica]|uniref:IpaD/SipD/SspD family type III secretion system needle tip protein n=2 Tax=Yersinia TaxID=629 RepID=A0A7U4GDZ8_YEREN|nr:IpaD/SipD/SspD family type III secretion system needle tip protein [Yersinia hibernica]OVZ78269.1 hypothetical protein CBW54_20850 [Yersinia kristensenii]